MTWWKMFPFLEWVNWLDLPLKPSSTCLGSSSLLRPDSALFCPFGNWMDCLSLSTKTFTEWQEPGHVSTTCPLFPWIACHRWHGRNTVQHQWQCNLQLICWSLSLVIDVLQNPSVPNHASNNAQMGMWCAILHGEMHNWAQRNAQSDMKKYAIGHGMTRN